MSGKRVSGFLGSFTNGLLDNSGAPLPYAEYMVVWLCRW
jgi:hypothetical protein